MARLSMRCSDEMVVAVDVARGDVPREVWLRKAVERALGNEREPVGAVRPSEADPPAPAEQPVVCGLVAWSAAGGGADPEGQAVMRVVNIQGSVHLSPQMLHEAQRDACESRASGVFAFTGKRTDHCVCGQHEGMIPIAPLLLEGKA